MEIAPGIHLIKESLAPVFDAPDCWTSVLLLVAERAALVDAALPRSAEGVILPYLDRIGLDRSRVDYVVDTHGHADHVGSNAALRQACRAELLIHAADRPMLEAGAAWGDETIPPHAPDRTLAEGDAIDLGSRRFEVLHLPGHSPGSIGLYDRASATLICGDSLQGLGTSVQNLPLVFQPDAYAATVARARTLAIEHLVLAHPYRPLTDSHARGPAIGAFLDECARFVAEVDDRLLESLGQRGGAAVATVADDVCRAFGADGATWLADITVGHYLERLARGGRVVGSGSGEARRYRLA